MKVLPLLLLIAAPLVGHAQFTFKTNNGTLAIKSYTGSGGAVVIPGTTNGLPIVSIGDTVFRNNTTLTNVTIPNGITNIGFSTFDSCTNLASVTIPNSVVYIDGSAFISCTSLTNLTLGNGVTNIGNSAFTACRALRSVAVPGGITSLGTSVFNNCGSLTNLVISNGITSIATSMFGSCTSLTRVSFPNSVTNIGMGAFGGCYNLTNLIIGSNVTSIGTNAFSSCRGLRLLIIPTNVITLADDAFAGCTNLTNIVMGSGLASIGIGAFSECTSLLSVTVPRGVTNIGMGAFNGCDILTNIAVDAVNPAFNSVAGVLFNKNKTTVIECPAGLRTYTIPEGVTNIQGLAFAYCSSLRTVVIPGSVRGIEDSAFSTSVNLKSVYFKGNAPSVAGGVFANDAYTTVYYLNGSTGWSATFGGVPAVMLDPSLGSLIVTISPPAAITAGGYWQVDGGGAQTSGSLITGLSPGTHTVTFNSSLGYYGWAIPMSQTVVINANSLTNDTGTYGQLNYTTNNSAITITGPGPAGPGNTVSLPGIIYGRPVTTLGDYAFFGRTDLTNILIPSSVTTIGTEVFTWCSGLRAIDVDPANLFYSSTNGVLFNKDQTTLIQYPDGVFGNYAVPQSVTSIGDYAFKYCELSSITIPNSVTTIGSTEFSDCSYLTAVYFQGNAPNIGADAFDFDNTVTVYYLPGTTGWDVTFGGIPAVLWNPQATAFIADGNQFGFNIMGPTNATIVVEACADLTQPVWLPVSTNTLFDGTSFFSDSQWATYPGRYYRFRSP